MPDGPHPLLILASASPRRLTLLRQIGLEPDRVVASNLDETPLRSELPREYARRIAKAKAEAVRRGGVPSGSFCLSADTVVAVGRRILPKAEEPGEAKLCLDLLSGRAHRVFTAVALAFGDTPVRVRVVETRVRFKRLSASEIDAYLQSGEWRGKAGGYAIQGLAGVFVTQVVGSFPAVVGLPLAETVAMLEGAGYPVRRGWPADLDQRT